MPWVQLVKIKCHETDDWARDEVYIEMASDLPVGAERERVWGPWSMNDGDEEPLQGDIPPREFTNWCYILVEDEEDVGWDNTLGKVFVESYHVGQGEIALDISERGSYTLTVRATVEKPRWPL